MAETGGKGSCKMVRGSSAACVSEESQHEGKCKLIQKKGSREGDVREGEVRGVKQCDGGRRGRWVGQMC